jgi:hypothetical protein
MLQSPTSRFISKWIIWPEKCKNIIYFGEALKNGPLSFYKVILLSIFLTCGYVQLVHAGIVLPFRNLKTCQNVLKPVSTDPELDEIETGNDKLNNPGIFFNAQEFRNAFELNRLKFEVSATRHFAESVSRADRLDYSGAFNVKAFADFPSFQQRVYSKLAKDSSYDLDQVLQELAKGSRWLNVGLSMELLKLKSNSWRTDQNAIGLANLSQFHMVGQMEPSSIEKIMSEEPKNQRTNLDITYSKWDTGIQRYPELLRPNAEKFQLLTDLAGDATTWYNLAAVLSNYNRMLDIGGVAFLHFLFLWRHRKETINLFTSIDFTENLLKYQFPLKVTNFLLHYLGLN